MAESFRVVIVYYYTNNNNGKLNSPRPEPGQSLLCMTSIWGMASAAVSSAAEVRSLLASAQADRQPFQLILLDVQMPDMDGIQTAKEIWTHGYSRFAPVILLTSQVQRAVCRSLESVEVSATRDRYMRWARNAQLLASEMANCSASMPQCGKKEVGATDLKRLF